jgi:predicted RNase H-like HicB family nuclease
MKRSKVAIQTDYGIHECLFTKDVKGYIVTCPSVEGVVTWGKSMAEAKAMAKEALELCIEVKMEDNRSRGTLSFVVVDSHMAA